MASNPSSSQEDFEKLKLLRSPLSNDLATHGELSTGFQQAIGAEGIRHLGYDKDVNPTLLRNSQAGNLETFYDLFVAACISLFNQNQQVNATDALSNYVGFFSLIWSTWLVTSLYDVRFVTDSLFERCARGIHMGVLIGFVTTSPSFDTNQQDAVIFQTFSIILMVSRLCIALQYGVIMWHTRKYKVTFLPLGLMVALNFIAAIIYLGVSFRFHSNGSSRVFAFWYALGFAEILLTLGLSLYYNVLSFQGTHLINRVSLVTLIIFGEAVAQACGKITAIVKVGSHAEWTSRTIGVVTAGIATLYVIFMLYFDWMPLWDLSKWRQLTWTLLHYPLHLSMTMFVEGAAQLILAWKIVENGNEWATSMGIRLGDIYQEHFDQPDFPQELAAFLQQEIDSYTQRWSSTYTNSDTIMTLSIQNINGTTAEDALSSQEVFDQFNSYMYDIIVALQNVLYHKYQVDFMGDVDKAFNTTEVINKYLASFEEDGGYTYLRDREYDHYSRVMERFKIVFQYTFICGGAFLAFSSLLYIIARRQRWTPWALIRVAINFVLALAIALIALVGDTTITKLTPQLLVDSFKDDSDFENTAYTKFVETPGVLPTLLGAYIVVLIANHITGDGPSFSFFKTFKSRTQPTTPPQQHVQKVPLQAGTKYDPGSHVMYDNLQHQPYAQQQSPYQPLAQPYTTATVYEYSGNTGPKP